MSKNNTSQSTPEYVEPEPLEVSPDVTAEPTNDTELVAKTPVAPKPKAKVKSTVTKVDPRKPATPGLAPVSERPEYQDPQNLVNPDHSEDDDPESNVGDEASADG